MTNIGRASDRILGSLGSTGGTGVVRIEHRLHAAPDDVWSALTDPGRLARWLGDVAGDLRLGGEFRGHFFASGWKGTGRIEACEPLHRLRVVTKETGEADEQVIETTLTPAGDETILVWEERGMPVDLVAAYAAGVQVHVEDLADYLAGRPRRDGAARFVELFPAYQELPADAA
jgi:uncharacterized protein YndB with AHSA1/START domain